MKNYYTIPNKIEVPPPRTITFEEIQQRKTLNIGDILLIPSYEFGKEMRGKNINFAGYIKNEVFSYFRYNPERTILIANNNNMNNNEVYKSSEPLTITDGNKQSLVLIGVPYAKFNNNTRKFELVEKEYTFYPEYKYINKDIKDSNVINRMGIIANQSIVEDLLSFGKSYIEEIEFNPEYTRDNLTIDYLRRRPEYLMPISTELRENGTYIKENLYDLNEYIDIQLPSLKIEDFIETDSGRKILTRSIRRPMRKVKVKYGEEIQEIVRDYDMMDQTNISKYDDFYQYMVRTKKTGMVIDKEDWDSLLKEVEGRIISDTEADEIEKEYNTTLYKMGLIDEDAQQIKKKIVASREEEWTEEDVKTENDKEQKRVRDILDMDKKGFSISDIAKTYSMHHNTVRKIINQERIKDAI